MRDRQIRPLAIVAAAALLLPMHQALGAVDCNEGDNADRLHKRYFVDECRKAQSALEQRAAAATKSFGAFEGPDSFRSWPARGEEQLKQYALIVRDDKDKAATLPDPNFAAALGEVEQRLLASITKSAALDDLNALGGPDGRSAFSELYVDSWKVSADPADPNGGLAAKYLAAENCLDVDASDAGCSAFYDRAVQVSDHLYVVSRIISRLHAPLRRLFRDEAERRTRGWNAYLYDAQFQYWWELAFNRYLELQCPAFHKGAVALFSKKCAGRTEDELGNEIGFREPPSYKATLLHPDVGVMYLDGEPKGDRFKPAILVQVVGYEWWDWKAAKIGNRRGLSLVGTASDNARISSFGYGLQFRSAGYAVAVTNHAGTLAVTLNLDLVGRVAEVNPKLAEELKQPLEFK